MNHKVPDPESDESDGETTDSEQSDNEAVDNPQPLPDSQDDDENTQVNTQNSQREWKFKEPTQR